MPEHSIEGGELWLYPDESIVTTIPLSSISHLGLVTSRSSGLVYASILVKTSQAGYRFGVMQWKFFCLERCICKSVEEAKLLILSTPLN